MPSRLTREAERNIRSNDFLQENKTDFTGNRFATAQINALAAKVAEMGDFHEQQISSDGGARQNYEIAEEANTDLQMAMRDIADFAATMADEIEGVEKKFRITRSGGKRGRLVLARAFAADAAPYEDVFIGRGLEPDFIADLNAKADRLEQALAAAVSDTAARIGSTESKLHTHKESNKVIALLAPVVRKLYRNNPKKLAAWDFASHIQRDEKPKPVLKTP